MLPRFVAAFVALFFAAPSWSAEDPLDAFPAETGVVLRFSPPSELTTKAKAFLNKAAPQFSQIPDQLGPGLGSLIGNPTLAGIDADRDWYVGVMPRAEKRPAIVFAAPTSEAEVLKKAVGEGYTFVDYEDWALYSLDAEAVQKFQARVGGEGTSVRESIPDSLRAAFAAGEIAAFLNVPALREAYGAQLEQAKEQLLHAAEPPGEAKDDPAAKLGMEYNRKALETLLAAIDDTNGVAGHIAIDEEALRSEAVAVVAEGSPTAAFLAKQSPSEFPLLAKLPRGRVAYYAMAGDFSDLIAASKQMSLGLYPDNEEVRKRLEELQSFGFEEVVGSFEFGDLESGVYRGVSLVRVDRPQEYLELVRELAKAMGNVERAGLRQEVTLKPEAETVEGVKVDVMTVVTTPGPEGDRVAASQRFLEVLFGESGMTQRMAVVDGLFVQAIGEGVVETAIKSAKGEVAGDETAGKAAEATRVRIGEKANLLVLYDLPRLLGGGLQLGIESKEIPLPIDPQTIEDINLAPSYTGVTLAAEAEAVRFRGVMPGEQVRGLVELFSVLQREAPRGNRAE